jgi:AraC-like DNA-binding protein
MSYVGVSPDYLRGVDILSDVITVTRTGQPRSAHVRWHAPWGQRFTSVPGSAGFQVILQGRCWLLPSDAQPVALSEGDVVFLPHGTGHTLADSLDTPISTPACRPDDPPSEHHAADRVDLSGQGGRETVVLCGAYQLDPSRAHPLLQTLPDLIHLPAHADRHPELRAAVRLLAGEVRDRPRLGGHAAIRALLDTLLLYMLRAWFDSEPARIASTGWAAAVNDPPVTAALHAIHQDPAAPWTVATLAAQAGLSRAHFARRFTKLVGQPPLTYLTWWRMTTAARLLRTSDTPLRAVAARLGYTSEFAFAAAFKRLHGMAPGAYRRAS